MFCTTLATAASEAAASAASRLAAPVSLISVAYPLRAFSYIRVTSAPYRVATALPLLDGARKGALSLRTTMGLSRPRHSYPSHPPGALPLRPHQGVCVPWTLGFGLRPWVPRVWGCTPGPRFGAPPRTLSVGA